MVAHNMTNVYLYHGLLIFILSSNALLFYYETMFLQYIGINMILKFDFNKLKKSIIRILKLSSYNFDITLVWV